MRLLPLIAIALIAIALPACQLRQTGRGPEPLAPESLTRAIESIKPSIAPVVCLAAAPDGGVRVDFIVGSAFFVSKEGAFVTARHVIADMQPGPGRRPCATAAIYIPKAGEWYKDGQALQVQWFEFAPGRCELSEVALDLARCRTNLDLSQSKEIAAAPVPVVIESRMPADGTDVAFTGFPLQIPLPRTSRGNVAGYGSANGVETTEMVIDKNAWPGASGSPVYLMNGHVVGIVLARGANEASGLALARTGNVIDKFLKSRP